MSDDSILRIILVVGGMAIILLILIILPIGNKRASEDCKAHGGERMVGSRQPFCITSDGRIVVW